MHILLIEDDLGEATLIQRMLSREPHHERTDILHVERLSDGLTRLGIASFDVVLLDLNLPDAEGLEGLAKVRSAVPNVPVVVLTGFDDDAVGRLAVNQGAQDFLVKGKVDASLLVRSIDYAVERHRLRKELDEARHREQQARERRSLEKATSDYAAPTTAGMLGEIPLRDGYPEQFDEFVHEYDQTIDAAVEQRVFKVEHDTSGSLRVIADQMGHLGALPRDAVEVHSAALSKKIRDVNSVKARTFSEEARYLLLELMGQLCSYYRSNSTKYSLPLDSNSGDDDPNTDPSNQAKPAKEVQR